MRVTLPLVLVLACAAATAPPVVPPARALAVAVVRAGDSLRVTAAWTIRQGTALDSQVIVRAGQDSSGQAVIRRAWLGPLVRADTSYWQVPAPGLGALVRACLFVYGPGLAPVNGTDNPPLCAESPTYTTPGIRQADVVTLAPMQLQRVP